MAFGVGVLRLDVDVDVIFVDRKPRLVRFRKSGVLTRARPLHRSSLRVPRTFLETVRG